MIKAVTIAASITMFFASCGKKPEANQTDHSDSSLYQQGSTSLNSADGLPAKNLERWVFSGAGDKKEGQVFCDLLSLQINESNQDILDSLSGEELELFKKAQSNASLQEVSNEEGVLSCKKESVQFKEK